MLQGGGVGGCQPLWNVLLLFVLVHQCRSSAWWSRVCATATLWAKEWCNWKCRYLSVCVLLGSTVVVREPSLWWVILVSKNGRVLCASSPIANWMDASMVFRCAWNFDLVSRQGYHCIVYLPFPERDWGLVCGQCSLFYTYHDQVGYCRQH